MTEVWQAICMMGFILYMLKFLTGFCLLGAGMSKNEKMVGCAQCIQLVWLCLWILLAIMIPANRFSTLGKWCAGDYAFEGMDMGDMQAAAEAAAAAFS